MADKANDHAAEVGRQSAHGEAGACDVFKAALRRGERPVFASFLVDRQGPDRSQAARELVEALLEHSREQGLTLDSDEVKQLNLEFMPIIEELLNPQAAPVPLRQLGEYELRRLLGQGGMGQVWLGWHKLLKQWVAVKLLKEGSADQQRVIERFEREMETLGKLDDPHIVRVRDARRVDGEYALVMDYVEGVSLDRLVRDADGDNVPLAIADACEMARQAALGLQFAHECGVVHRDVKPSNLILARDGTVKILDFGLARGTDGDYLENQLTDSRSLLGTLDYMAPEQFDDPTNVGAAADIYSLGCTLYCLLGGKPPYAHVGPSAFAKADAHRSANIAPPSLNSMRPDVDKSLARVVSTMLAKPIHKRFASARDVAVALAPFCAANQLWELASQHAPPAAPAGAETRRGSKRPGSGSTLPESKTRTLLHRRPFIKQLVIGGAFAAGLGIVWWGFSKPKANEATKTALGIVGASSKTPAQKPQPQFIELASTIGTLPSLCGAWWFEEIPYFIPPIRQLVVESILAAAHGEADTGQITTLPVAVDELLALSQLNDVLRFEAALNSATATCSPNCGPRVGLWIGRLEKPKDDRLAYREDLTQMLKEVQQDRAATTAASIHFQALLNHKLALNADSQSRQGFWEEADRLYERAQVAYDGESKDAKSQATKETLPLLKRMCIADWTVMFHNRANWEAAESKLNELLHGKSTVMEQVYLGGRLGEARAHQLYFFEANDAFVAAERQLAQLPDDHPLQAKFYEFRAWHFIDRGEPEDFAQAIADFERANEVRGRARKDDWRQKIFEFHNDHGVAVALSWQHKLDEAKDQLHDVQQQLNQELIRVRRDIEEKKAHVLKQYHIRLVERFVNSTERYADCYLFGNNPDYLQAAKLYATGVSAADDSHLTNSALLEYTTTMQYLAAIALRMAGGGLDAPPSAESNEAWKSAQERRNGLTDEKVRDKFEFTHLVAGVLFTTEQPDRDAARDTLLAHLRQVQKSSSKTAERSTDIPFSYLTRDDRQLANLLANPLGFEQFASRP